MDIRRKRSTRVASTAAGSRAAMVVELVRESVAEEFARGESRFLHDEVYRIKLTDWLRSPTHLSSLT